MQIELQEGAEERRVVTGMVVSTPVLARIAPRWDRTEGLCNSTWANLIGGWCVRYYGRYGRAPGPDIRGVFESWSSKEGRDKNTVALVDSFLASLSGEYVRLTEDVNPDYTIDMAARYFTRVRALRAMERAKGAIAMGEMDDAVKHLKTFDKMDIGAGVGVDILTDVAIIEEAFRSKGKPVVTYPGALGQFLGDAFERDAFVAILAPEKRGKSWVMMDIGWQAMLQRKRVAFFQCGDMSQNQFMRRLMARAARAPIRPGTYRWPTALTREDGQDMATVTHDNVTFNEPLDANEAMAACRRVIERDCHTDDPLFKLFTYPNDSVNVNGIEEDLANLHRHGWEPELVIVDYADILAPLEGRAETRDQINATWKRLRRLSQELHCCVVTATQADAASYNATTLTRSNFSEDKRKLAHTTAMLGLNANDEEKRNGVLRINWIVLREDEYVSSRCVHVAGCLGLAAPMVLSCH